MGIKEQTLHMGWIQCTQCGWGSEVSRSEVEAGDYTDRQACDHCGIGPCRIDWDWPDGPGWKYEEKP
jgi:hypothetical protein